MLVMSRSGDSDGENKEKFTQWPVCLHFLLIQYAVFLVSKQIKDPFHSVRHIRYMVLAQNFQTNRNLLIMQSISHQPVLLSINFLVSTLDWSAWKFRLMKNPLQFKYESIILNKKPIKKSQGLIPTQSVCAVLSHGRGTS